MELYTMKSNLSLPLSVGVIGGGFGQFHIRGLLTEPEKFVIKAFCDQSPAVIEGIKKNFALPGSCAFHTDYQKVIGDPTIDGVFISLPHHLHESVCIEAAESGKHIMLDKPIARTLEEADRIIESARKNQVTLMIAHQMRFYWQFRKMHELISKNVLGRPLYAETCHHQNFNPPATANWRSKSSVGGGCVIGSGIHNIDLMRWFFGEPAEIFAFSTSDSSRLEAEVAASISVRFKQGTLVNFSCNWGCHGAMDSYEWGEWTVFCTQGDIAGKNGNLIIGRNYGKEIEEFKGEGYPCESIWTHFAECIIRRTEPLINGPDARASLALVQNIYQSIATGKPVLC
jgi:UDP-N-acetyl-2-amino-2-deoxyglucuronate dehydrogenase